MIAISLNKQDIEKINFLAKAFAKHDKWLNSSWQRGLINETDNQNRAEFIGMCGEMAFAKFSGLPIDDTIRARGNNYDFLIPNTQYKIDVKTHAIDYGRYFIKAAHNDHSPFLPLKSDIYVFAHKTIENENEVRIVFDGWITRKLLLDYESNPRRIGRAIRGEHLNFYVQKNEVQEMSKLLEILKKYQQLV